MIPFCHMYRFLLLALIFLSSINLFSQQCYPSVKKTKRTLKKIEKLIQNNQYDKALYELKNRDSSAVFKMLKAEIFFNLGDYYRAEIESINCIALCPDLFPRAYFFLGYLSYKRGDYLDALKYLDRPLMQNLKNPYFDSSISILKEVIILADIISNPVDFKPKIINGVSTKNDEYLAVISPDQKYIFFTRRLQKRDFDSFVSKTVEEFMIAEKNNKGFNIARKLGFPFNIEENEGGASITADNNFLCYTKCERNIRGYNNCDIYYVFKVDSNWSKIQSFKNSISMPDSWESQPCVSADGSSIIFSSDRKGGYGGTDLYEIKKINNKWSDPVNLGPIINSSKSEKSPFLHIDGKTLFFSSNNFPSLGGFDIFYSKRDSLDRWTMPKNIGFPINSKSDETSLFVTTDGETAYFSSNNLEGLGGWDIYSFKLYNEAKPERVIFLSGYLTDENQNFVDSVDIEIKNMRTNEIEIISVENGSYSYYKNLNLSEDLLITIKKDGYSFHSSYISSDDTLFSSPTELDIKLDSLESNKSFTIENIYFDNNSYQIKPLSEQVLVEFSKYLLINNSLKIEISGFTDDVGGEMQNQLLSEKRAKSVCDFLILNGILSDRVSFKGYGEQKPAASNLNEDGRKKNRRIEFKVINR
tara:strand:- start:5288 stop:7213 length:1926 start_codon:yes stop_codon:yes gene_type:complete